MFEFPDVTEGVGNKRAGFMEATGATVYLFGGYRMDAVDHVVSRDGRPIPLSPKEFETLLALVENCGRLVTKEQLMARVWAGVAVGEGSLARNISVLRKRLGAEIIETVPRLGYRLCTTVAVESAAAVLAMALPETKQPPAQPPVGGLPPAPPGGYSMWLAACAALTGLSALGFLIQAERPTSERLQTSRAPVRIAVLPFVNLTGEGPKEYLSDGLTEEVITALSQVSPGRLAVIARTSSMSFKNTNRPAAEIGRTLKVDYLLEGSVREATGRFRINSRLVRTADQLDIWDKEWCGVAGPDQGGVGTGRGHRRGGAGASRACGGNSQEAGGQSQGSCSSFVGPILLE